MALSSVNGSLHDYQIEQQQRTQQWKQNPELLVLIHHKQIEPRIYTLQLKNETISTFKYLELQARYKTKI